MFEPVTINKAYQFKKRIEEEFPEIICTLGQTFQEQTSDDKIEEAVELTEQLWLADSNMSEETAFCHVVQTLDRMTLKEDS